MKYQIETIPYFRKRAKKLIKKHPSLKQELSYLNNTLTNNPQTGTPHGKNCFKIRLSIKSKKKGKSGGARIISHIYVSEKTVYLLYIYDKSEQSSISDKEIADLLKEI